VSVKTAELLGFYGHGVTRVKVEYVGRAPLQGSDDRKLIATLREGSPATAPVQVVSSKPFAPAYFDGRSVATFSSAGIPSPPDRPYRLGEGAREVPAVRSPTTELAAATRPRNAGPVAPEPADEAEPISSPVPAYMPTRYNAGFSGHGLY
jgi:peptidoglycan lytic transglycosylase